ncbi:Glycosyl phosphatidyl inositol protein transamidase complex subunit, partial [Chytridiales sp. JEL 0842]
NINGIAYAMALSSFYIKFSHWSKDIILLISDEGVLGAHAWLQTYHGMDVKGLAVEPLVIHGGVIEEAINLEFSGTQNYDELGLYVGELELFKYKIEGVTISGLRRQGGRLDIDASKIGL